MGKKTITVLFLGSGWESVAVLSALYEDKDFKIVGAITKPDRPVGREVYKQEKKSNEGFHKQKKSVKQISHGQANNPKLNSTENRTNLLKRKLASTATKEFCLKNHIPVFHTKGQSALYKKALQKFSFDLGVCVSFGEMIPEFFLNEPKFNIINVHFSLLPKYRGAVPVQMSILNGDSKTGISIVKMVKQLDAGPVLFQANEPIHPDDTNSSLRQRLVKLAQTKLPAVLRTWCDGKINTIAQDDKDATYCRQADIAPDKAFLDFSHDEPVIIERKVRTFLPWPIAWCKFQNRRLNVFKVQLVKIKELQDLSGNVSKISKSDVEDNSDNRVKNQKESTFSLKPGEFGIFRKDFWVGTKDEKVLIKFVEVQLEGHKKMKAKDFVNGVKLK